MGSDFHSRLGLELRRESKSVDNHEVWPVARRYLRAQEWLRPQRARRDGVRVFVSVCVRGAQC